MYVPEPAPAFLIDTRKMSRVSQIPHVIPGRFLILHDLYVFKTPASDEGDEQVPGQYERMTGEFAHRNGDKAEDQDIVGFKV